MSLLKTIKGWFKKEPDYYSLREVFGCSCGVCGYQTPHYPNQNMADLDLSYHKCNPPTLATPGLDINQLKADYETAKAKYEEALVKELSGLEGE